MLNNHLHAGELAQALISNLPGGAAFVVDRDLRYLVAEGEALSVAGFKSEDFVGRTIFEVLPPDLAASYELMYRQALAGEPFEHEHHAHNHTYISRGTPLRDDNREIYAALVVSYDISGRKRAEESLHESEARLQSIANLVPDLLWESQPDGSTNWYNQRWMEYTGQTFEQAIGWGWIDAIHPDDREESARRYREAVAQGMPLQQEHRIRRHDGAYRWFVVKAVPFKDESGKVIKMYGAATDIHDRKQVEDALRESEDKYRALFMSMDEAYAVVEVLNDDNGEWNDFLFLEVNPVFVAQTGMEYPVGRRATELLGTPNPHWARVYGQVAETGEPIRFEEGEATLGRVFDLYAFRLGGEGSRRVAVLFTDITGRKQRERQQEFILKLSDALRPLSDATQIEQTATRLLGEYLQADRTFLTEVDEDGMTLHVREEYLRSGASSVLGDYSFDQFGEFVGREMHAGRILAVEDVSAREDLDADERANYAAVSIQAYLLIPLIRNGRLAAYFTINHRTAREWSEADKAVARQTADRTWASIVRARAEEALRRSEGRLRALFESIDEGFSEMQVILDEEGHVVDWLHLALNGNFSRVTGIPDITGCLASEVFPNLEGEWFRRMDLAYRTGEPQRFETELAELGRWFDNYITRLGGEDDNRVFGVFGDITERKRREQQQAFLLTFSDTLRALADEKAIEETGVRMLAEFLRLDRAYIFVLYPSEDRAVVRAEQRKENLASLLGEVRMSDFPETVRQIENQTLVINDIDSDARLSDLNRTSLDAVNLQAFVCASVRKGERNVIWSLAASTTVPRTWTKAELELIETVAERMWAAVERAKAEKALREAELQRLREQSAREQERQRAESLAELDRAKTLFFSNISHEFRTPLTLSLAPLQDALNDRVHPLDPVHRERLELVHRNSLRLLKLVNTLLDFSRIEAGRRSAVYEPTDLATYTAELASVFRSAIEQAGLQLIVDCQPLPQPVFVDREMWEKIVLNLLSNAFKFTFEGKITVSLRVQSRPDLRWPTSNIHDLALDPQSPTSELDTSTNQLQLSSSELETLTSELETLTSELEPSTSELEIPTSELEIPTSELEIPTSELKTSTSELETPTSELDTPTSNLHVILQICDTGTGIAPKHLPHLFERFYQVRGTQARTYDGSGIGLALVHDLVQLQGGSIEVSSTWGKGTCFTIALTFGTEHLPRDHVASPQEHRLQSEDIHPPIRPLSSTAMVVTPSTARVLVIDDNTDMREYLTRILSNYVQVEAVADGATALAVAQERVPDLILSDVMMPGLNGFELLGALRSDPRTREVPILLLSARAGEEAIVEGLEAGADDYLIKPFSAQELISRVTAHLQMAQLRGAALQQERIINRQKDEFISIVSHELNTPLVSILAWTRMLRSSSPNSAMLNKALDTIERNATLQGKLIQDLLDISRITAGKLRLNSQPIELQPVIETAIATVSQSAADKGIPLTWQDTVADPVVVMGDGDRLSQVLINLLTNAIKFTPESGSVQVELSVMNDAPLGDDSYAEIRVIDTGIGIAVDFLPHVFERFRQAEGANAAQGLGLGLVISHHIIELHNGTIHASSAGEGQGATFTVRLPLLGRDNR